MDFEENSEGATDVHLDSGTSPGRAAAVRPAIPEPFRFGARDVGHASWVVARSRIRAGCFFPGTTSTLGSFPVS